MGRKVFRAIGDVVACFEEPNTTGSELDIDAPRNAPMKTPLSYLSAITWHSAFDQFELAAGPTDVTVTHPALGVKVTYIGVSAGGGVISGPIGIYFAVSGDVRETDILLYTHNLGYKPRAKVTIGGRVVTPGHILQNASSYSRSVSVFVTTTGVYLRDVGISSNVDLPAHSQTYRVYVFRQAQAQAGEPLFSKTGALMTLARDIVRSDKRYLRRTGSGDQEFSMDSGPTLDVSNGHKRVANGGVLTTEPGYGGSMAAPSFVTVGL